MQRALSPAPRLPRARWLIGAAGVLLGLGAALALPAEATGAVARFFDTHVVEAFHGLALERFLCL